MRAALYIRASTDDQAASAEEQERGALAWCKRQGHEVVATFRDVGVSGAEWKYRPGVLELERQAKLSPRPFDLVAVRDASRLGRDTFRLPLFITTLHEHGVKAVAWSTGEELAVEGATAKLMLAIVAGVAEMQREAIAHTTRTALRTRAERGLVAGGRVYGYDNVRGPEGVRYVVNEREAAVVREIAERRAASESGRSIACDLNRRGIPSPHAGARGSGSWCASQVRFIASNPRYRGEAAYGRLGSKYVDGSRVAVVRSDAVTYAVEPIVDAELFDAAQVNTDAAQKPRGGIVHRGPRAKYLLVGHAVCVCGGRIATVRTSSGVGAGRTNLTGYACGGARERGTCDLRWRRPVDRLDGPVLDWLINSVLAPDVVADAIERERARANSASAPTVDPRLAEMRARVEGLERNVARLVRAIESVDGPELLVALRERNAELADARRALAEIDAPPTIVSPADASALLAQLRDLRPVVEAARAERPDLLRAVLGAVLVRPIRVTPDEGRGGVLRLEAEAAPGALLDLQLPAAGQGLQGLQGPSGPSPNVYAPASHGKTKTSTRGMEMSPGRLRHSDMAHLRLFLRAVA